ncbi:MAG: transglycosylase domain-containing protein [Oligoflexia bacterium]|nr:transglycosylase domain-containing protein [Oligoflexia bacterium]
MNVNLLKKFCIFLDRKNIIKIIPIAVFFLFIFFVLVFIVEIIHPIVEIPKLKSGYIKIDVDLESGLADYTWSKQRPAEWASLRAINPYAVRAIVTSEDGPFYLHAGLDLEQMKEAIAVALSKGGRIRGASTITQQVVKNLYLTRSKSIWRKLKEIIIALYMDKVLSKNRILELYLNIIEYGENLYGISPAARFYFGQFPETLSPRQGAFLAMLLPSPKNYSESFRQKRLTPYAKKVIKKILHQMAIINYISMEKAQAELQEKFWWETN